MASNMADPKYKNLPYIAVGEPDVYETDDLPEADQAVCDEENHSESVEKLLVDPKDAFLKFNKSTIDSSSTDFERVERAGKSGFGVHYELLPSSERQEESVLQKLQRIKCELKEIEDVAKTGFNEESVNPKTILSEVESLQRQIDGLSESATASQDQNLQSYSQLLSQLKAERAKTSPKKATSSTPGQADTTMFELCYVPETVQAGQLADIDSRLTQLEHLIGSHNAENRSLNESINGQTLMDSIATLSSKLHLLDEDKVDKLSARLQVLLQSVTKISESSSADEVKDMEKVNELYDLVKKWDECCDTLPTVVDRLYTLQDLHQQAMEFSASLKALETAQQELGQNLQNHDQLLGGVQKTFAQNVDTIKSNMEVLETRMSSLK